jgi:hypothetical protein
MSEIPTAHGKPAVTGSRAMAAGLLAPRALARDWLHLASLSAVAIAQPLFDLLGRNPAFFAVRGSTSVQILELAIGLVLVPPTVLLGLELIGALILGRLGRPAVHLAAVAALVGLVVLEAAKKAGGPGGTAAFVLAAALGLLVTALYARIAAVQAFVTFLVVAPVVVVALFLVHSPVRKLVFSADAEAAAAAGGSNNPVVVVIFDEFSGTSLMNSRGEIDASRFPNFAALARDATWYRNATTVSTATTWAVPAILTGQQPNAESVPTFADHPRNLFTLLGDRYRIHAQEPITSLCPSHLCPGSSGRALTSSFDSLLSDLAVVFGHLVLPDSVSSRLPPIGQTWGNFGAQSENQEAERSKQAFDRFVGSISPRRQRVLYFAHVLLPHVPWHYLPSGKEYNAQGQFVAGLDANVDAWGLDHELVLQGEKRYLLQVGYVDRLLGELLRRLRVRHLYADTLLVVTADHGVSFHAGEGRRWTRRHAEDIAFVPLFVKKPHQQRGGADDTVVRSIDILPTVADALGMTMPWQVDGHSLRPGKSTSEVRIFSGRDFAFRSRELVAARQRALARQTAIFGSKGWWQVYGAGPDRALVGNSVARLRTVAHRGARAEVAQRPLLAAVDPRRPVQPLLVSGTVEGDVPARRTIAIAVNRRIAAVTSTYSEGGKALFAALVPEGSLRNGSNSVDVFAVARSAGGRVLERLTPFSGPSYSLHGREIVSTDGRQKIRVVPGAIRGYLDSAEVDSGQVSFSGWAADLQRRRIRDRIIVFANGRFVYSFDQPLPGARRDLPPDLRGAGFRFSLPERELTASGRPAHVQIFAVIGRVTSEVGYPRDYRFSGVG